MNRKFVQSVIAASLPIVFLAAGAQARHIKALLKVANVPDGALVRACFNHASIVAVARATDSNGAIVNNSQLCDAQGFASGVTVSSQGIGTPDGRAQCNDLPFDPRNQVVVTLADAAGETLCIGKDGQTGQQFSSTWTGSTACTLPANQGPRLQFSQDGGKHFGNCFNADITGGSQGDNL